MGQVTADAKSDTVSSGVHGNSSQNVSKAAVQMMTPQEVMRKPREDAIVFLEGRNPVYDMKALPFDLKNGKQIIPGVKWLKERYNKVFACGSYEHPVYTEWDEQTRRYVTLADAGELFYLIDRQDIPKWEELAADPKIPLYKIEQSNGQTVYYLSEKKSIDPDKVAEMADMVFRRECSDVEKLKRMKSAVMADKDIRQDYINQLLYNCRPRREWSKKETVSETLDAYFDSMTMQEKELVAWFIDRCKDPDAVNNFIVLPVDKQISILEEMDSQKKKGDGAMDVVFIDEDTLTEEEWEVEADEYPAEE